MQNGMILFLIWKRVMRNRLSLYLDRKRIMRKGKTIFLIWKMVMQNRLYLYLNRERVMWNVSTFYLNRGRVVRNGILDISVGAYCIRPLNASSKETYDQKFRYMWGVFNTPLPWRTKRSIPKINFLVIRNGMTLFLIRKIVMRNGIGIFLNWEIVMQNVLTFYLNRGRVVRNGILDISVGAYCIRPIKTAQKETYDQKYRYMCGVCNTPLPWRQKRSIPKINFLVMQNGMTLLFDLKNVYAESIIPLFGSKKDHAKR